MSAEELRAYAESSLGDSFSLQAFHDVVLKNGPVPLNVLAELVDGYIKDKKTNYSIN